MSLNYFLTNDSLANKVYKHSGFSSTVIWTLGNAKTNFGLDYDYAYIYTSYTGDGGKIVRYICDSDGAPSSGLLDSFSSPSTYPNGVISYGGNIYSSDYNSKKQYKHSGFTATISDSFSSPSTAPFGISYDGINLYSSDIGPEKIYKHSGFSKTVSDSFSSPSTGPGGMDWDGTNIFSSDYSSTKIYKHTGFSKTISDSFSSPSTQPVGVTSFNTVDRSLSVSDTSSITEVITMVRDPSVSVFDSISITEWPAIVTPPTINSYEQVAIIDLFETASIINITIFDSISVAENSVLVCPKIDVSDIISVLENLGILVSPIINVYDSISSTEVSGFSGLEFLSLFAEEFIFCESGLKDIRRNLLDVKDDIIVDESVILDRKQYGLKIINPQDSSIYSIITPEVSTIISAGRITMPDSLNGDGTYGVDIELPDLGDVPLANIGVMIFPVEFTFAITNLEINLGGDLINNVPFMSSSESYYEHVKATGQMVSWVAGNLTDGNGNTFDHIAGMFPVAFWDIMGQSTFTKIRLFAGMCYLVYDTSASAYKKVFSIGSKGVSKIDYTIVLKRFNPQPKRIEIGLDNLTITEDIGLQVA